MVLSDCTIIYDLWHDHVFLNLAIKRLLYLAIKLFGALQLLATMLSRVLLLNGTCMVDRPGLAKKKISSKYIYEDILPKLFSSYKVMLF